jgi:protein-L-isoaspartate(D-aspartate) O-methyltransferase
MLIIVGIERMFDAANARRLMVEGQVRTADVTDVALLDAMLTLPRERFLPPSSAQLAYIDGDIPVGRNRALLKPMVLAKLIQAARVRPDEHVLDVGCATGYSAAVLARLAASVTALEEDAELARQAKDALAETGASNVEVVVGPLTAGWPHGSPYDVILLEGASEVAPETLGRQLKPGGRLVGVHGRAPAAKAMIYYETEGRLVGRPIFDAAARVLPGFAAPPSFVF